MATFSIVKLGHIKHKVNFNLIQNWSSKLFTITGVSTRLNIPDGKEGWQEFTDKELAFVKFESNADITVAITEYALEDNYYLRRLDSGVVVISLYEVASLLEGQNVPLEHFILRNLYELNMIFLLCGGLQPTKKGIPEIIHDETRSCLFDMSGLKSDVIFSTSKPSICTQCFAILDQSQLPSNTLHYLKKELHKIRKPRYYRIAEFVKQHPILSMCMAAILSLAMNLVANLAYDMIKSSIFSFNR